MISTREILCNVGGDVLCRNNNTDNKQKMIHLSIRKHKQINEMKDDTALAEIPNSKESTYFIRNR
jgi:hypothetical protein